MKFKEYEIDENLRDKGIQELMKSEVNRISRKLSNVLEELAKIKEEMPSSLKYVYETRKTYYEWRDFCILSRKMGIYIDVSEYKKEVDEKIQNYLNKVKEYKPQKMGVTQ